MGEQRRTNYALQPMDEDAFVTVVARSAAVSRLVGMTAFLAHAATRAVAVCAKIELEIAQLEAGDAAAFLDPYYSPGLDHASFSAEATAEIPLSDVSVATPLESTVGHQLSGKKLTLVPILRAGLGMVEGINFPASSK